jgi:diadenosine tetraphosphatase ApaH/serine/threonine PP2A family protein phosphatase
VRIAVFGDIHGNLEALEVVLEQIDRAGVDRLFCLGDVVGYGPNPNECVARLRERTIPCLMGNHDAAAAGLEDPIDFNPIAREALEWTRAALAADHLEYLRRLPDTLRLPNGGPLLVHGSPTSRDEYLFSRLEAEGAFEALAAQAVELCFFGHTHVPAIFTRSAWSAPRPVGEVVLEPQEVYLINGGGVGQPRDYDPRAAYLIFEPDQGRVHFHRVEYPIETTATKICGAGLPLELATRLYFGL